MRKILLSIFLFLVFFQASTHAQTLQIPGFDYLNPVAKEGKIDPKTGVNTIELLPFTAVFIDPGTFPQGYTLVALKGRWNDMKKLIPADQSPISAFALVFYNKEGLQIKPSKPIKIQSFNNFTNTDTFFYPIKENGEIDMANYISWPGHIKVVTLLPIDSLAFIVGADVVIPENDPTLDPTKYGPPVTPPSQKNSQQLNQKNLDPKLPLVGILVALALVIAFILKKRQS